MPRPLVLALDGSELAERALPYAAQLAAARQTTLVLVRAVLAPMPSGQDWERQQLAAVEGAEKYLVGVAERLAARGLAVEGLVRYGPAAAEILKVSREVGAAEVVMATHGRTGLSHLLYGSVAEAVLAGTSIPVFLVHARPGEEPGPVFDPRSPRVMLTLDGSPFAEAALGPAIEFAGTSGELLLLRVMPVPEGAARDTQGRVVAYVDQLEDDARREAAAYLDSVARRLAVDAPDTTVRHVVRVGEPAPSIVSAAVDRRVDLVVMATHGRTGLGRAVLGSVAGQVVRLGTTPLVLVHPKSPVAPPAPDAGVEALMAFF